MKEKMKATSSWWEKKVIYDSESVTWQFVSMRISEKHQKSEKSKKDQIQILSLDASEILINQQKQTVQNEKNNSEEVFIKKNKNWYKTILHEMKNLQTWKKNNLIMYE